MSLKTLYIVLCFLLSATAAGNAAENCSLCHKTRLKGAHRAIPCTSCHKNGTAVASLSTRAAGCVSCHRGYEHLFDHAMGSRGPEKRFIERTYGKKDRQFDSKNCSACHIKGCLDCHGEPHAIAAPKPDTCSGCHKGYFVGWDFFGRAPREEHERYQRGKKSDGDRFLKMLPDVHQQKGMACKDCHSMQSLIAGKKSSKGCTDCHRPNKNVIEHSIQAHMERLECAACHAAWSPQEYGTFYIRFDNRNPDETFNSLSKIGNGYAKSVYLKRQDSPPLGINSRGKIAPIRPQFIAYYTNISSRQLLSKENELMAAEWRAFAPHTIQRGSVICDGCHDNRRRFLLERPEDRIYLPKEDGLTLSSFWDQKGQKVVNGGFLDEENYRRLSRKSDEYRKGYVKKWKAFLKTGEASSAR